MAQTRRRPAAQPTRQRPPAVVDDGSIEWTRYVVAASVILVPLAVLPSLFDLFALPKLVSLGLSGIAVAGLAVWGVAGTGWIDVPWSRTVAVAAGFVAMMALSTVIHDRPMVSLLGEYGRNAGLLSYAAALFVFLGVLRSHRRETLSSLAWVFVASAAAVTAVGLFQIVGIHPLQIGNADLVVSTLGQVNFVAGYMAMVLPFVAWAALRTNATAGQRTALGLLAVGVIVVAYESHSFQAFPAAAAGLVVIGGVEAFRRFSTRRVLQVAAAGVVLITAGGLIGHSYLERQVRSGLNERVLLWQAGDRMVEDAPVIGRGPAGFAADFTTYRPRAHAIDYGPQQIADAPHSVPLGMVVSGGALLGLLYLAFVVLVGRALVRGLRRLEGSARLLLAAFGGAWVAYQVQSIVSIDVPPLILTQFVLAAAILVLAGEVRLRRISVSALAPVRHGRQAKLSTAGTFARGLGLLVAVVAVWFLTVPVRADIAYRRALDRAASGQVDQAAPYSAQAVGLAPWNGLYWAKRASVLAATGDQGGALGAGAKASTRAPSAVTYALSTAQLAHRMQKDDVAVQWFDYAIAKSPNVADALNAKAQFLLDKPDYKTAIRLASRALELKPGVPLYLEVVGLAYEGDKQGDKAVDAFRRLVAVNPKDVNYNVALAELLDRLHRADAATQQWEAVLALEGNNVKALARLGRS